MTNHNKPRNEGCVSDIPQSIVIDVCLHLQVEEETLIDDVGNPATTSGQEDMTRKKC